MCLYCFIIVVSIQSQVERNGCIIPPIAELSVRLLHYGLKRFIAELSPRLIFLDSLLGMQLTVINYVGGNFAEVLTEGKKMV